MEPKDLPVEVLHRIATIVNAANPAALEEEVDLLQAGTMNATVCLLTVVVGHAHAVGLGFFKSPMPKEIKQLRQVAQMAEALHSGIQLLEGSALMRLESKYFALLPILKEIRALADAARSASLRKKEEVSHRPPKSFKSRGFELLIHGLYRLIVVKAQGTLTLWQDAGDLKGTLPLVLEVVRPYIPGILPVNISFSTLHRSLVRAKKEYS